MRGFDICSLLPEKCHQAPASDAMVVVLRRVRHVAATSPHGQRRPAYFGNSALALTISELHRPVGASPVFAGFPECPRRHQAESFLIAGTSIRTSILNFVQGYSKVDRTSATRFKRYQFMCSSA